MFKLSVIPFALGLMLSLTCKAQNEQNVKYGQIQQLSKSISTYYATQIIEYKADSAVRVKGKPLPNFYSKAAFNRFFDEYFTLLNYQRQSFADGNSAGIVFSENDTRLNLTLSRKMQSSILSLGAGLNIKDQSGTIFSGDKPTSGTQINLNYSYLIPKSHFFYDPQERARNYENRKQVLDSVKTLYTIRNPAYFKVVQEKLTKSTQNINLIQDSLLYYEHQSQNATDPVFKKKINEKLFQFRESMVKEIDTNEKLKKEFSDIQVKKPVEEASKDIEKATEEVMIRKQFQNKAINSFWFSWISGGVSYKREVYDTYDSLLAFSERIGDRPFNVWSLNASYNFFYSRTPEYLKNHTKFFSSMYAGITYSVNAGNTYADISATDISVQTVQTHMDSIYLFSTSKKLRDVSNAAFQSYTTQRIGLQFTGMFGKHEFVGINLSGFIETKKSITTSNLRTGLLFKFKDSEGKKPFINFELFLLLRDLDNQNEKANKGKDAWERKEIGVSTVIPFQKVFFR